MEFEKVEKYLKAYTSIEPPYDANGAIHLLKASIENLQENFSENDFETYSACLNEENEKFLIKLLKSIPKSRRIRAKEE